MEIGIYWLMHSDCTDFISWEMKLQQKFRLWLCVVVHLLYIRLPKMAAGPAEDLIYRLPGQPKVNFKQYGGYVTVDEQAGRALYYYFAEAEDDSHSKPLTLWLAGGPGCSSVGMGAFTELGPFYPTGDGRGLRKNFQSWNKVSNLLFVESPAGVGWSYSNTTSDYSTGDEPTAKDMLIFLTKWIKKFPEYASRDLFLTGESYAGHYIPQLAAKVLKYNEGAKRFKFNFKGLFIVSPLLSLNVDVAATYDYLWSHGLMSDETYIALKNICKFDEEVGGVDILHLSKECNDTRRKVDIEVGNYTSYTDTFDVIIDVCPSKQQELLLKKKVTHISLGVDVCVSYEGEFYFNLPDVQKALHANTTKLPYSWTMCTSVLDYNATEAGIRILSVLKDIIQHGIRVWIGSGDQDSVVSLLGTRTNVRELANDLKMPARIPYRPWYHKGQVAGWTTAYGNLLTFATVRGGSHEFPYTQPARAFGLFRSFLSGEDLPKNR